MPRRRITFRQLETFAEVARQQSFTKAAGALHLTQPAVSIQIRQIAETIGLPLFEQNGREIALTASPAPGLSARLVEPASPDFKSKGKKLIV